jgi:hypothetical protein
MAYSWNNPLYDRRNPIYDRNNPLYDRRDLLYDRTIPRLSGLKQVSSGRKTVKADETWLNR